MIDMRDVPDPMLDDVFATDPPECGCRRTERFLIACEFHNGWFSGWTRAAGGPSGMLSTVRTEGSVDG